MRNGDEWERRVFIRVFQGGGESERGATRAGLIGMRSMGTGI
jgi:hypothetical protein